MWPWSLHPATSRFIFIYFLIQPLLLPVPLPCMLLILPLPSFLCDQGKMTGPVLEQHYTAVADASPIPVVLYRCGVAAGSRLL